MRSSGRTAGACLALAALLAVTPPLAQERDQHAEPELPERAVRPLPADTFKPSEEISEDFPVPFPVDI